jgi:hypothetical protein
MLKNLRNISRTSRKPFNYGRQVALLAFGIVGFATAIAWNTAFLAFIDNMFITPDTEILVKFLYAIFATLTAIFLLWCIVKITNFLEI